MELFWTFGFHLEKKRALIPAHADWMNKTETQKKLSKYEQDRGKVNKKGGNLRFIERASFLTRKNKSELCKKGPLVIIYVRGGKEEEVVNKKRKKAGCRSGYIKKMEKIKKGNV